MYDTLTVYHGGTEIIKFPNVQIGRPNLDFGPGSIMSMLGDPAIIQEYINE